MVAGELQVLAGSYALNKKCKQDQKSSLVGHHKSGERAMSTSKNHKRKIIWLKIEYKALRNLTHKYNYICMPHP